MPKTESLFQLERRASGRGWTKVGGPFDTPERAVAHAEILGVTGFAPEDVVEFRVVPIIVTRGKAMKPFRAKAYSPKKVVG